jgi:tryptophanyl-tRNA synthetase
MSDTPPAKKRVFSGIQPTGNVHIGNYLGAIKNWVASQDEYENIFCIVDLHAITVPQKKAELRRNIRELAGLLFACGIDPQKSVLFVQSHIAAHAELAWLLTCMTPLGWLERMTQFKDKSAKQETIGTGLLTYPTLMAADIILYDTDLVPVGDDQKQHLELTRDIVQRVNHHYNSDVFKLPTASIPKVGARVMGLDDPTTKMSKSETGQYHAIRLLDAPNQIRATIKRATTDSQREIRFDEDRPGVNNLLTIYEGFTGLSRPQIEAHFQGKGYADLKKDLTEVVIEGLKPIQARYKEITADKNYLDTLLSESADNIRPIAQRTLTRVYRKMGLR